MQNTNRKCKIKNILFHTAVTTYTTQFYESYKPNNQTQPNEQYNDTNVGFIFKFRNKSTSFVYFIQHQFLHSINPQKPVRRLMNNLVHFICPYMNPLLKV